MKEKKERQKGVYDRQAFSLFAYHSAEPVVQHSAFHFHNNYELLLIIKEEHTMYICENQYHTAHGILFAINTEKVHKIKFDNEDGYERYVVHFSQSLIQPLMGLM